MGKFPHEFDDLTEYEFLEIVASFMLKDEKSELVESLKDESARRQVYEARKNQQ